MKQSMDDNNPDVDNERQLWHGTAVKETSLGLAPLISICSNGFNRNYSSSTNGNYLTLIAGQLLTDNKTCL